MKRKSRNVVKELKKLYAKVCSGILTMNDVPKKIEDACGEKVDKHLVTMYFKDRKYRERYKGEDRSSRCKTSEVIFELENIWTETDGICPKRNSLLLANIQDKISFHALQQWFGQKRFKNKSRDTSFQCPLFAEEIADVSWVNCRQSCSFTTNMSLREHVRFYFEVSSL